MEKECIICKGEDPKVAPPIIHIKEWIIDGKTEAKHGDKLIVHVSCLDDQLYVERPEGFVFGRISLGKEDKGDK